MNMDLKQKNRLVIIGIVLVFNFVVINNCRYS